MTNEIKKSIDKEDMKSLPVEDNDQNLIPKEKTSFSYFSGAMTSAAFAWLSLSISKKLVSYFIIHSSNYSSPTAQSIASAFKTLVIGMSFLATFSFGFISFGLFLVFFKSLLGGNKSESD